MAGERRDSILPSPAVLVATGAVTFVAWSLASLLWSAGNRPFAVSAFALGLSLGPCLTAYATAPRPLKPRMRRLVLLAGGLSVLGPALLGAGCLGLQGFLLLFAGAAGALLPVTEPRRVSPREPWP